MNSQAPVKLAIVGLGRWAKVLTNAAQKSDKIEIIAGHSRSQEKRDEFTQQFGVATYASLAEILAMPEIEGVIITVPNEQHYTVAKQIAEAGKHIYTEKPISNILADGLRMEALQKEHNVTMTVGHSARLLKGIQMMKNNLDDGSLGKLAFIEANFSNERALELTPDTWRWYRDRAPGGPLSQLAIHMFDILHYLGGDVDGVSSIASKLSPVGAEVDDQSMSTVRFKNGVLGYVGSCWTSPGIFSTRVFAQAGLMHFELDFASWDDPENLHKTSSLYIQRGKDGYGLREDLEIFSGNMFQDELEIFAEACRSGKSNKLTAHDGNIAVAMVYAALKSIDENAAMVSVDDIISSAKSEL
ncbi:MAG: Gfo/Idh/MocA family oxidoreductase [Alphaproteobacteria bacterium]|nr:Gfo/Idh/MocA family oxidoreductase [Alphaproteobacteria bacterium]